MRRFRRFRLGLSPWVRRTVILVAALLLLLWLFDWLMFRPLAAVAETEARLWGIDAINRVALGTVGRSLGSDDLVAYQKDQEGRISGYSVKTQLINLIASEVAAAVHKEFRRTGESTFRIPLGAASGSRLLATTGPGIPVRIIPIGSVTVDVQQAFESAGINQTRHRVWLRATAQVRVILPVVSKEVQVTSDLPITETVIVGPVPQSFYGGKLDGVTMPLK